MMKKKDILHVPLVDGHGYLVGLETLQHLTELPTHENCVFLMAGGFGKRLRPLTLDVPKPLLKVGTKPILETILEQFVEAGFYNFYISTHYKAEMVSNHFGDGEKWGVSIQYVYEEKPLGTAGALGLLPEDVPDLPVIVMNGDLLTKINLDHLLQFHKEQGGLATMCVREYDFQVPYGVIQSDGKSVTAIEEKPIHSFFVNAGIYLLEPDCIGLIPDNKFYDMPRLFDELLAIKEKIVSFPLEEYWLDIGRVADYEKAKETLKNPLI